MSKSVLYVANTNEQSVVVGGSLNLGNVIRRCGCASNLSGTNVVSINEPGYYDVNVSVTAVPTAAGDVTITLLNNGVVIPGATATATVAAAGDSANISFESVVRIFCNANAGTLSLALDGTDANVSNIAMVVKKL